MNTLNAFVEIPSIANNAIDKVAIFGELSVKASTYTKDIRNFVDKTAYPNIELTTFAILDETSTPVPNPSEDLTNTALSVSNFLYTQYSNNAIPLPTSKATLVNAVASEFSNVRNVRIGDILESGIPGKRLIDYIRYDITIDSEVWRVTLWFSDAKFRLQYPLYDIVVIPPLGDISRLIDTPATVIEALSSITIDYTINRMAAITNEHSATTVYTHTVRWHDPAGTSARADTKWTVVIYGGAGNDLDLIKDAIRRYISDNSNNTKWPIIFPDLYSENEFLLMPLWGMLATPTDSYDDGLYSSLVNANDIDIQASRLIPPSFMGVVNLATLKEKYLGIMASTYRGIMIMNMGNPNNVGANVIFKDMYPDYMAVSSDRPDFARMSSKTQEFVLQLLTTLEIARNYTLNSTLPSGYSKATKANREYIGFDYEGFTYYVLTRIGYLKDF